MKERVRETLFQLLGTDVPGTLAIDLFAGTGMLGFEALSRGSVAAVLVERHFPTADRIKKSAAALGLTDRVTVRSGDTLLWGRRLPDLPTAAPWLVFVSPPGSFFAERQAENRSCKGQALKRQISPEPSPATPTYPVCPHAFSLAVKAARGNAG